MVAASTWRPRQPSPEGSNATDQNSTVPATRTPDLTWEINRQPFFENLSSYHLIIRRRESGHAHSIRVALANSRSRGHLLKAIQSGSADTADLRCMLNKRAGKTTLLWIPGHHGIAGNEEADACAKQAAAITDGANRPVSFAAACNSSTEPELTHRLATAEQRRSTPRRFHGRLTVGLSPRDAVLLTRLRAGHTPSSRLTPISSTRQSTPNALVAERSRKP